MKATQPMAAVIFLSLVCAPISSGQDKKAANLATSPPNLVLLVHQEVQQGKAGARQKLEVATTRACDRLDCPNYWIDLRSLTGQRETLFFDPFDSFEELEQSIAGWGKIYAGHPDLARMQEEIDALVTSERTIVAVRRDDLGYRVENIDLSEARFMRVLEVRLFPGHESDFVGAFRILGETYEKIKVDTSWVVYQVNLGMQSEGFLIFVPMPTLKQNDDLLSWRDTMLEAQGEETRLRLQQIAREAYATTESNLYAVSPETSHVSKEFAAGDPDFWTPKVASDMKPVSRENSQKTPPQKDSDANQK